MQTVVSSTSLDTPSQNATTKRGVSVQTPASQQGPEARLQLQDLIPIVMVIVGGCEPCAEKMVKRALEQGSSEKDIDMTLRIVADMEKRECFAKAVGTDVVSRMEKPLAAGWKTLQQAMTATAK